MKLSIMKERYKNISMKEQLYFTLYCLLGISILLSSIALLGIISINKQIHIFYSDSYTIETNSLYAKSHLLTIKESIYKSQLTNKSDLQIKYINDADAGFEQMVAKIDTICNESKEIKSISAKQQKVLSSEIKKALRYRNNILKAMEKNNVEEVLRIFRNDYSPILDVISNTIDELCSTAKEYSLVYVRQSKLHSYYTIGGFLFCFIVSLLLGSYLSKKTVSSIISPLNDIVTIMNKIANGNLQFQVTYPYKNEYGNLFDSIKKMHSTLISYIVNIQEILSSFEHKDITKSITLSYQGDFKPIQNSLEGIQAFFVQFLHTIGEASNTLYLQAKEVSLVSLNIANGANEQNASTQHLCSLLEQTTDNIETTTDGILSANDVLNELGKQLSISTENILNLTSQISDMSNIFRQIDQVNSWIVHIAEETNLLALNATIEAARVESSNSGMSVIARQIQKLSKECSDAVGQISNMILTCQNSLKSCISYSTKVNDSLDTIESSSINALKTFEQIVYQSSSMKSNVQELLVGITQITKVAEYNSVLSSEGLDSGRALQNQSYELSKLLQEFKS